jgi:hypothetical protein
VQRTIILFALVAALAFPAAASAADLGVTVGFDQVSKTSGVNVGQTVTATATITNTSATRQNVTVVYTLTGPNTSLVRTQKLNLKAGEAVTQSQSYTRDANDASGDYTLTVAASDKSGTTTASATVHYN